MLLNSYPYPPPARPRRRSNASRRVLTAIATAAIMGALTASTANAHVRVHADSTATGSFAQLTFRVPTESDTASTTKLEVTLPQDKPFLYVSTKPVPGWTATVTEQPLTSPATVDGTTVTKAARTVTWQAQTGAGIAPGQYQDFDISGPLPAAGTILLPAVQTYSDGSIVTWDQPTPAGGPEAEHPAPQLVITAATPGTGTATTTSPATAGAPAVTTTSAVTSNAAADTATAAAASTAQPASDPTARLLAGLALLIAILGTGWTILATRRRTSST